MSGFLDKLKDAGKDALGTFVEFDEQAEGAQAPAPPAAAPAARTQPAPGSATLPLPPVVAGAPDPEFVQQLQAAVAASKLGAYGQFRTLFTALGAVGDDAQRTQLALSAAQATHGVSAEHVAEAVEDRIRILAAEREAFDRAVNREVEHTIGGTEAQIREARAEIARRQEEIRTLEARCAELERSIAEARAAIDANSARFAASYAVVESELVAERARISAFVPRNGR